MKDTSNDETNIAGYGQDARSAMTGARALPVFDGYTVDVRLREFRKMDRETGIAFVPFASDEGDALLARYMASLSPEELRAFIAAYCAAWSL